MANLNIIILAGGFGRRLKDVLSDVPKPMAPVNHRPFLDYQISIIEKQLPNHTIYVLTHYLSEVIEGYYKDKENVVIIKENEPLGTGGSIKNAIHFLKLNSDASLLVLNGDTYLNPNLIEIISFSKYNLNMLASFQADCDRYGSMDIVSDEVVGFNEKEVGIKNSYINAGCYYFKNTDFFNRIDKVAFSLESEIKKYLSLNNHIGAFKYNGVFIDIGIPKDYYKMIEYAESELV